MKLKGWVAKDEDGGIFFHLDNKPKRREWFWNQSLFSCFILPKDSFPDLTWEDEPIEVTIEIKEVKE